LPLPLLLLLAAWAFAPSAARAATATTVVTATVPSATSMSTALCQTGQAGRTAFGNVLPGSSNVTTSDCEIGFNSTNDSSMLRLFQQDGYDTAMARSGWTLRNSGVTTAWEDVDFAPGSGSRAWIVGGGGARNRTLMKMLAEKLSPATVETADQAGWSADALEAQAFAFLAVRSLKGLALTFPTTTGVAAPMTGGVLVRP
jgi:hypothetical protein